jgi:hypothetical protein
MKACMVSMVKLNKPAPQAAIANLLDLPVGNGSRQKNRMLPSGRNPDRFSRKSLGSKTHIF